MRDEIQNESFADFALRTSPSLAAARQLDIILNRDRVGTVQGVEFDFRHPDLPGPETWHSPEGCYPFGIAFPWDRENLGETADAFVAGYDGDASVVHVYSGDRVSIGQVRRFWRGGFRPPYVDEHDTYALWAYLTVQRNDGTVASPTEPIQFNARDAMGPHSPHIEISDDDYAAFVGDFRVTFRKVTERIQRLCQAAPNGGGEWLILAAEASGEAEGEVEYIEGKLRSETDGKLDLSYLLDLTAAAAYALAKAEVAPVIRKAANVTRPATLARRRRTDPIRHAAVEYIAANPTTSQTACASAIAVKLGKHQRQVERAISGLFTWKKLHGGGREKRPRAFTPSPVAKPG